MNEKLKKQKQELREAEEAELTRRASAFGDAYDALKQEYGFQLVPQITLRPEGAEWMMIPQPIAE